ncbi:SLC13 family permease [Larkinella soli]|uniref:SLC13 family permease n=1 Tax=Larkinella soli TaxID=1770527 RepID=UPI000FFC18B1|nr:SLC13 family permease [Larkinella soli]
MEITSSQKLSGTAEKSRDWFSYGPLLLGPLVFGGLAFSGLVPLEHRLQLVLGVAGWIMVWWITEAVPMPVTAFLPLVLFPSLGILDLNTTAANYTNPTVLLFLSGFIFALAMEQHRLHVRIALHIVRRVGTASHRLVLGFMTATAFVSMWVNNTAAALLMLPIAGSVMTLMEEDFSRLGGRQAYRNFSKSMLLGLAYAASIGGIATSIGTPTNAVLVGYLRELYRIDLSFSGWFIVGFPLAVLMLTAAYFILTKLLFRVRMEAIPDASDIIARKIEALGPVTYQEYAVSVLFSLTAAGWIFRTVLAEWLGAGFLNDTIIGMSGALLLFILPDRKARSGLLFDWTAMAKLPWGILFIIGGGLALAKTLESSGLIKLIGETVAASGSHNPWYLLTALTGVTLLLKLIIANTALATVALPMAFGIADALGLPPIVLAAPVTFAASFAFVLPMSTPPNAIVLTTGQVTVRDMIRAGLPLTAVGFLLLIAAAKIYQSMV